MHPARRHIGRSGIKTPESSQSTGPHHRQASSRHSLSGHAVPMLFPALGKKWFGSTLLPGDPRGQGRRARRIAATKNLGCALGHYSLDAVPVSAPLVMHFAGRNPLLGRPFRAKLVAPDESGPRIPCPPTTWRSEVWPSRPLALSRFTRAVRLGDRSPHRCPVIHA